MNKIYKSPLTKSQIVRTIAEDTGLSRRDVAGSASFPAAAAIQ